MASVLILSLCITLILILVGAVLWRGIQQLPASATEEGFAAGDTALPWNGYAAALKAAGFCHRNLEFTAYKIANLTASQRALPSTEFEGSGSCTIALKAPLTDVNYAKVKEDLMPYHLKSICLKMNAKRIHVDAGSGVVRLAVPRDDRALAMLFLLDPLYVEVNGSSAYLLDMPQGPLANNGAGAAGATGQDMWVTLKPISAKNDALFMYPNARAVVPSGEPVAADVTLYYLDSEDTGRRLEFPNSGMQSSQTLYDVNYASKFRAGSAPFQFSQTMYTLLTNRKPPVLSLRFELLVTADQSTMLSKQAVEILKVYMDHPDQYYPNCGAMAVNGNGPKINNWVSVMMSARPQDDAFVLSFATGARHSCQFGKGMTDLDVRLPYTQGTGRIAVNLILTPTEKQVLAQWRTDKNYYVYRRSRKCSPANDLADLFSTKGKTVQNNVTMLYNNAYVPKIAFVELGRTNLYKELLG